jgi:hypothetical protein
VIASRQIRSHSSDVPSNATLLFTAIGRDKREASAFFGMITGVVPMGSFFSPPHLIRLLGVKDFLRLARARSR